MSTNTLSAEQGGESLPFWDLAFVDTFAGAFWLADDEFADLNCIEISTLDTGGKNEGGKWSYLDLRICDRPPANTSIASPPNILI